MIMSDDDFQLQVSNHDHDEFVTGGLGTGDGGGVHCEL